MIKVLHLTAHLGGGVGKALSGLVCQSLVSGADVRHTIVTFEQQEKNQFVELIKDSGAEVFVSPLPALLCELVEASDIVQLEWWNHPATIKALCAQSLPPMRLIVWSHVSGLFNPIIPRGLLLAAHQFLFTSACSYEAKEVLSLPGEVAGQMRVVSSSGGFDGLPLPESKDYEALVAGYIGSLNFAKLHPLYVDFLSVVSIPAFKVSLIGDVTNKEVLEGECGKVGRQGMLEFRGYTNDIVSELSPVNVLVYLLNPEHYGTTENALLEAMAMGIVPIVLNNPAERFIVKDRETGFVVTSPEEFGEVIEWLYDNPNEMKRIGRRAAESVRKQFAVEVLEASLNNHYGSLVSSRIKQYICFKDIFGEDPFEWFVSCQGNKAIFNVDFDLEIAIPAFSRYGLTEETKGSVFHFQRYFPENSKLNCLANRLSQLKGEK